MRSFVNKLYMHAVNTAVHPVITALEIVKDGTRTHVQILLNEQWLTIDYAQDDYIEIDIIKISLRSFTTLLLQSRYYLPTLSAKHGANSTIDK